MKLNKRSKTAQIDLYAIYDLEQEEQLNKMLKIAKLFDCRTLYVSCSIPYGDNRLDDVVDKSDIVDIRTYGKHYSVELKTDGIYLNDIIKFAAFNDVGTVIYIMDDYHWEQFVSRSFGIEDGKYDVLFLIKDNDETSIVFSIEKYDSNEMMMKIDQIL